MYLQKKNAIGLSFPHFIFVSRFINTQYNIYYTRLRTYVRLVVFVIFSFLKSLICHAVVKYFILQHTSHQNNTKTQFLTLYLLILIFNNFKNVKLEKRFNIETRANYIFLEKNSISIIHIFSIAFCSDQFNNRVFCVYITLTTVYYIYAVSNGMY